MADLLRPLRNRGLVTLMLGHFTVDSYVGLLPVLYPLLINRFQLNLETVGLVTLAYSGIASVSQPLFGILADRHGTRFTGLALVWTAATFSAVGFVPTFPGLVVLAALSGLGSGAFHPFGALTVRGLLPDRGANTAMSIYVTGGTVGVAAGPLIGVGLVSVFGIHGTLLMLLPGTAIAGYLLLAMRLRDARAAAAPAALPRAWRRALPLAAITATVAVMACRNVTVFTLQGFTPTWYHQLGFQPWFYGPLVTTLVLSSALGTVGCGALADRFGRKTVITASLLLSLPVVALYVLLPGRLGFLWAVLVGSLAASTGPLTLMMAMELMAGRAGLASGLVLGLAFVTAAIGVPVTGAIADKIGLQAALGLQVAVVAVTVLIAMLLPSEQYLRQLREQRARRAEPALATGE
ncbi:MAG TPA: MFS transporter [Candidatus Dormibacteraeota bacterium]|nr:MFS transporter [Candidatus Dormibacteraeota bacterium]